MIFAAIKVDMKVGDKVQAYPSLDLAQLEKFLIEAQMFLAADRPDQALTAILAAKFQVQLEMSKC